VSRAYRFTAPSTGICLVYKTKTKPWGIAGGREGDNNHIVLNPGTDREVVQGGSYNRLQAGEVLVNNTGGGGGYGDPFEREPARVAADVRNGFVSVGAARREYGVVVDPNTFAVDEAATAALRASARKAGATKAGATATGAAEAGARKAGASEAAAGELSGAEA
jgi:N-methylhydantoinase B